MRKKSFAMGKGVYYIRVKTGPAKILIKRKEKKDAVEAYFSYIKTGKECEWLGKWDGKTYTDNDAPTEEVLVA
jgi:hypothetical protein